MSRARALHPRVRAARALDDAAASQVDEIHAAQLPDLGLSGQINRSTGNAVPGTFFPTPGFASISGPPRGRSLRDDTWQSGASIWVDFSPTNFAKRAALADAALAAKKGAAASVRARSLEVAFAAADAYLAVAAASQGVVAAGAGLERAQVFAMTVKSLVDQSVRPGVDAARAEAEVALAQTQLARALQTESIRRAELAELIDMPAAAFAIDPSGVLSLGIDAPRPAPSAPLGGHPLIAERAAAAESARLSEHAASLDYLPRVDVVAAFWARGSGYYPGGFDLGPMHGSVPDTLNTAVGVVVDFRLLDIPLVHARVRTAKAQAAAANARRDEAVLAIDGQLGQASAFLDGARRVAKNTPVALAAAQAAQRQALARYRAGLVAAVDVADAQRVLLQAEIEHALARLDVCRAHLYLARAAGDLSPFLDEVRAHGAPR